MTKNDDKRVPVLRFKGFNDDWAQRKLGDIANVDSSKRIHRSEYTKEGIPFFRGSEITDRKISNLIYISKKKYNEIKNQYGVPKPGDLLITAVGTIGNIWKVDNTSFYYKDGNLIHINPKCIDEDYLVYYFQFLKYKKIIDRVASGSNQKALTIIKVQNLKIKYPQKEGQSLIGVLLKKTENLIALQQRKLQQLKLLKKAMLQDLFADKAVPKLRFRGFKDYWVPKKLGDIANFINGRAYKQNELLDKGKYKVLRVGNFYTNDSWYFSNLELKPQYYINKGDLVYTWSATFGPHIWRGEKVIYHYHIWKINLSKSLNKKFVFYLLKADKAKLLSNTNGSTMIHITKRNMESKTVLIPNTIEQSQIRNSLDNVSNLITFQQEKIAEVKQIKQFLLQNMFI